jgi:hypothetical protein
MIYASPAIILSTAGSASLKMPVFLWRNRVTAIEADDEEANYPASNLGNGQTISQWRSTSTDPQYLTFSLSPVEPINAFGIERHNLGSGQIAVTVEGLTGDDGAEWQVLGEFVPGNDGTIIGMIEPAFYIGLRFLFEPQETPPRVAVVYVGDALVMPRSLPEGFVLPGDALERETVGGVSESGDFLGEVTPLSARLSLCRSSCWTATGTGPTCGSSHAQRTRSSTPSRLPPWRRSAAM